MKNITSNKYGIDLFVFGNVDNFGKYRLVLLDPRAVTDRAADVPIRGVEEFHELRLTLANFKFGGGISTSSARVAQAGIGKHTGTGVGISG